MIYQRVDKINNIVIKLIHVSKMKIIKKKFLSLLLSISILEKIKSFFRKEIQKVNFILSYSKLLQKNQDGYHARYDRIQLFENHESLRSIIQDIDQSSKNVNMMFYIWSSGGLVDKVSNSLIEASGRGVECKIIADYVGSWLFFRSYQLKRMKRAGIKIVKSLKISLIHHLIFSHRLDSRQHKKIVTIDDRISYIGSMNMVDPEYRKKDGNHHSTVDILIRIEGEEVSSILNHIHSFDWYIETGEMSEKFKKKNPEIKILSSGILFPKDLIENFLIYSIKNAKKNILITTPYFIPSKTILKLICATSLSGVHVSIVLPKENNSCFVHWASRNLYEVLLRSGVKIYHFYKGFLHTKIIIIDKKFSIVGSINLDIRSLSVNFEVVAVINDFIFVDQIVKLQTRYIRCCSKVDHQRWNHRPLWNKVIEKFCYFFRSLL
ncbi:Cardiolipin synthetase [Candidatus Riesia pediculischaeffi PTSU]|uniref:Cardiolipin synthase n=1 Tax=Candidatus Riesia pediculischaeffi PTSU TaxID=1401651 RepID=A0A0C1V5V2_9ENTR|nr:Cardiolipin synthetase [Candidatus Riesia pediculischaeffi PTSU]